MEKIKNTFLAVLKALRRILVAARSRGEAAAEFIWNLGAVAGQAESENNRRGRFGCGYADGWADWHTK